MMNQMVSMVGPMAHVGHGMESGKGMEEGMGVVRQGHALSEDLGPGFGRGMGMTRSEGEVSHAVGHANGSAPAAQGLDQAATKDLFTCPMHPEVGYDKPGECSKCGMTLERQAHGTHGSMSNQGKKRVPGYPQDDMMMMAMDEAVAKPENYGLAPGWSASLQGMMNLIRVLPAEKYEEVMKRVRERRVETPAAPAHKHDPE